MKIFLFLFILFSGRVYSGDIAYVSDCFKITLRKGPGIEYKIIAFLKSGERVEILESAGEWTKIRSKYGEGWVLSRFLMKRTPFKDIAERLEGENNRLKEELSRIKEELEKKTESEKELKNRLSDLTELYSEIKQKYEKLLRDSSEFLELKKMYEKNKEELRKAKKKIERLEKENLQLKRSQKHRWFLLGALVLFSGIILGLVLGRQRKRSSYYY